MKLKHLAASTLVLVAAMASAAQSTPPIFGRYHDDLTAVVLYEKASHDCNVLFNVSPAHPEDSWMMASVTRKGAAPADYCWLERWKSRFLVCPTNGNLGACFNVPLALLNLSGI
jgi:hypothetical protein